MQRTISVIVVFFSVKNTEKTNTHIKYWSWKYPRPILQERDQDQDHKYQDQDQDLASQDQDQDQDQDRIKVVSSALETETEVSRTTSLTCGHPSATGRAQDRKVRWPEIDVLPLCLAANLLGLYQTYHINY